MGLFGDIFNDVLGVGDDLGKEVKSVGVTPAELGAAIPVAGAIGASAAGAAYAASGLGGAGATSGAAAAAPSAASAASAPIADPDMATGYAAGTVGAPAAAYASGDKDAAKILQGDTAQFGVASAIASAGTLAAPAAAGAGGAAAATTDAASAGADASTAAAPVATETATTAADAAPAATDAGAGGGVDVVSGASPEMSSDDYAAQLAAAKATPEDQAIMDRADIASRVAASQDPSKIAAADQAGQRAKDAVMAAGKTAASGYGQASQASRVQAMDASQKALAAAAPPTAQAGPHMQALPQQGPMFQAVFGDQQQQQPSAYGVQPLSPLQMRSLA